MGVGAVVGLFAKCFAQSDWPALDKDEAVNFVFDLAGESVEMLALTSCVM